MGTTVLSILVITAIVLISVGFCALSVGQLYDYIQAYRFERSQYTLLLGFIPMKTIIWIYVLSTLLTAGIFVVLYLYITL